MLGGDSPAMLEIAVQASYCRLMKRDTPALFEFCLSHEQCLRVEVIELESERFRNSQSRNGQQSEKRAVHVRPERILWLEPSGRVR